MRDELLKHLRDAAVSTDFTSRYQLRRTPTLVDGEKPDDMIHTLTEHDARVQYIGHRVAAATLEEVKAENHDYQHSLNRRFVVDDHVIYTVVDEASVTIASSGLVVHQYRHIFDATFGRSARSRLVDAVQRGIEFTVERPDENTLLYTFRHGPNHPDIIYRLTFDVDPVVRLRQYEREAPTGAENIARGVNIQDVTVHEWLEVDGKFLPKRAELIAKSFNRSGHEGQWLEQRTTFERTEFEVIEDPAAHAHRFDIAYEPGMVVQDQRYDLIFEVGSKSIQHDGVSYELAEPLMEPPGARLYDLLKDAKQLTPVGSAGTSSAPVALPSLSASTAGEGRTWVPAILIGVGATLVTLVILRALRIGSAA